MDETFIIPVNHDGAEREFQASLQVFGYSHRFHVSVEDTDVLFERDEEGHYRAIIPHDHAGKYPGIMLLQSIAHAIEHILT